MIECCKFVRNASVSLDKFKTDIFFPKNAVTGSFDYTGTYRFYGELFLTRTNSTSWDGVYTDSRKRGSCCIVHKDAAPYVHTGFQSGLIFRAWIRSAHLNLNNLTVAELGENDETKTIEEIVNDESSHYYTRHYAPITSSGGFDFWYDTSRVVFSHVEIGNKYFRNVVVGNGDGSVEIESGLSFVESGNTYIAGGVLKYVAKDGANYSFSHFEYMGSKFTGDLNAIVSGNTITFNDSANYDISITAVYAPKISIRFEANDNSGAYVVQNSVSGGKGIKLNKNTFSRNGYSFVGWSTSADSSTVKYTDKSSVDNLFNDVEVHGGDTVVLYAVWVSIKLRKLGTGADESTDVNSIGSLYLLSSKDGYDSKIEPTNGATGEWLFAPEPNTTYRVGCTMSPMGDDRLWVFSGVTDTQNNPIADIVIDSDLSNIVLNANFTRKVQKIVDTGVQMLGGEDFDGIGFPVGITMPVTSPSAPDTPSDGKYILGTPIVATPNYPLGADGWHIYGFRLDYFNDNGEPIGSSSVFSDAQFITGDKANVPGSNFTDNMTVVGLFARDKFSVTRNVDTPSMSAITDFRALVFTGIEWADINVISSRSGKVRYNETVRLVKTVESGFIFDGFYANGEKITAEVQHDDDGDYDYVPYVVRGNVEFVAKAAVSVKMAVEHWDNRPSGSTPASENTSIISVEGVEAASHDLTVVLGDTIGYSVVLGNLANIPGASKWKFDAWYAATDTEHDSPLELQSEDAAFAPTATLDIVARVVAEEIINTFTVGFKTVDADGVVTPVAANGDWVDSNPASASKTVNGSGKVELTYVGTKSVELTFNEAVTSGGKAFAFTEVKRVKNDGVTEEPFSSDLAFRLLTNRSLSLVAYYSEAGNRTIGVALANNSDRTMGTVAIVSVSEGTIESGDQSATVPVGQTITFRAIPSNGYRFVGWFYSEAHDGNPKYSASEVTATVIANRTLYAYFVQDTHAVYEWEGRSENKMMMWRSKVYVSQIPFNPSAIRVDATDSRGRGTAVNRVEVGMMSSPDAAPVQSGLTVLQNMPNYVARRLPKRRPERYLYVEVQNDAEVDRIIVGTSMEGLRV